MKTYRKIIISAAVILAVAAFFTTVSILKNKRSLPPSAGRTFPVMGTIASISLYHADRSKAEAAADSAQDEIRRIESICNRFNPASELSRLNASAHAGPFKCSDVLWELIVESEKFYRLSGGAFDVTVAPLMKMWGFNAGRKTLPSEAERVETLAKTGFAKLTLDPKLRTVAFKMRDIQIDLGGIAKGYALDKAAEAVAKHGVERGIINIGGNIRCLAKTMPDAKNPDAYVIGVRHPLNKRSIIARANLLGNSISTSGNYERCTTIRGRTYTHIIDPRTGRPVENILSVSVVTRRGIDSDAISTAVFVGGGKLASAFKKNFPDSSILIISKRGNSLLMQCFGKAWLDGRDGK